MLAVERKLTIEPGAASALTRISQFLSKQGIKAYLVGGLVRDALLGRPTADIDIAVDVDALDIGQKLAGATGGRFVPLDEVNRVCRVVLSTEDRLELDLSTLTGDIEQDLSRRDFTIDAMAIDLSEVAADYSAFRLIDPFNGESDLRQKVIRVVSDESFKADPIRLLRAVRLAAELGFSIEPETEALVRRYRSLISVVAGERIREELLRLLAVPDSGRILPYLDELGLVTAIIPELTVTVGVEQPREHFWDVFHHSINAAIAVDFLLRQGDWHILGGSTIETAQVLTAVPWSEKIAGYFEQEVSHGSSRRTLLKLAALLHDIAKPQTKAADGGGRVRFLGHAQEGAIIAAGILERLRFSAREIKLVETMVRHHLRPTQVSQEGLPSRRAVYRYLRDTGEAGIDTLFLSLADHLATRGPQLILAQWQEHANVVKYILECLEPPSVAIPPKLVDGHDLIRIFGLKPGPEIGELLDAVREAQAAGELTTREEALSFLRQRLQMKQDDKHD